MGLNINKMVGYGLTDVTCAEGCVINDSRINPDSSLVTWDGDAGIEAYIEWLRQCNDPPARRELSMLETYGPDSTRHMHPDRACVSATEYGLPNVLCLRPVWAEDWHRLDDTIDYLEEGIIRAGPDGPEPRVDLLRSGIYPFNAMYVDIRTGVRLGGSTMDWIRARNTGRPDGPLMDILAHGITAWHTNDQTPIFTSNAEAQQCVAHEVPEPIRLLAEWGRLFVDPLTVRQLRPMVYTWWS